MSLFEISVNKLEFIGDCVWHWPPAAFFQKLTFLDLLDMPFFEKGDFLYILSFFQKWLPRPNGSAHIKGIEIPCKTAVWMSRDVSSESKFIRANSKYSFLAWMSIFFEVIRVIWGLASYFLIVLFLYSKASGIFLLTSYFFYCSRVCRPLAQVRAGHTSSALVRPVFAHRTSVFCIQLYIILCIKFL